MSLGTLTLTKDEDWVYTLPVEGELFRVTHFPVNNYNERYLKGVVCQGFFDDGLNIFDRRLLTWREEKEVMLFHFPVGLSEHFLAFKRLDENSIVWNIKAEVFLSDNAQEDFANYVISRFGELMPLFDTIPKTSISIEKEEIKATVTKQPIQVGIAQLVQVNGKRRGLSIYNPSEYATVTIGCSIVEVDGENVLEGILSIIAPGKVYELPVSGDGSCYSGQILGKANDDDSENLLQITQFEAA